MTYQKIQLVEEIFTVWRKVLRTFLIGRYLSRSTRVADAFTVSWREGFGYIHPPMELVPRVIEKAKVDGARGCS